MKQKDISTIIFIIVFSAVISLILSNVLFSSSSSRKQQVEIVDKITSDFAEPDAKYFNKDSINPTQTIQIGDNANTKPFNGN